MRGAEIGGAEDAAGRNKKKGKKGKGKAKGSAAFEVVPQDSGGRDSETARSVGRQPPKAAVPSSKVGPNTLRLAHSGANTSKGTSAERKASEIWFRKCGHGERLFSQYYKGQPGVVPADKWQTFEETLNTPLPVTFRLHGFSDGGGGPGGREQGMALELLRTELEKEIDHLHPLVQCVDWAPKSAGIYQCAVDKRTLSKDKDSSELAELLADGVSSGLLNRQEAVSMLPVMALKVEPGMCCLDTCASPGSKTMQLLEAVAAGKTANGLVVANDAHPKRVHQLMDTIDRHSRPAAERARLVVTCHRGEEFPRPVRPFINKDKVSKSSLGREALVGFDRVLCDVPCSGDGTIRKDATVRPRWTPAVGNQLHAVQLDIAWRGLCLLRVGGLMAYSTCTYNPIEDEAVVAGLLARANAAAPGSVELEEWPDDVLPKLVRHAGLHHWGVADHVERSGAPGRVQEGMEEWSDEEEEIRIRWHRSLADARAAHMAHAVPTMWPPAKGAAKWMRLERCSRLLPHDQDTGGFFIALLRKKAPFPASSLGSVAGVAARDADARGAAEEDVAAASLDSMDGEGRGSREGVDGGLEGGGGRGKAGKGKRGGGKGRDAARRKEGPASCRELPLLERGEMLVPLQAAGEVEEVAQEFGVPLDVARRRLLARKDAPGEDMEEEVFWAPAALAAFSAGQLNLARAGMTLGEAFESGRLPSENAPPVSGVKREGAGEEAGDREGSGGKVRKKAKREVDGGGVADGGGGGTKSGKKKQTKTD